MFSVGQRVWHRDGKRGGKVVECDGDRVYIEQDNGAELDFSAADLTTTPPASAVRSAKAEPPSQPYYAMPNRVLSAADITPEHAAVLAIVPVRTVQAVAALYEKRPGGRKFSALTVAEKINLITEITAIPYRTMREYRDRPGELGLMMGKGLADSQRGA
jgi:hypothetical protein